MKQYFPGNGESIPCSMFGLQKREARVSAENDLLQDRAENDLLQRKNIEEQRGTGGITYCSGNL